MAVHPQLNIANELVNYLCETCTQFCIYVLALRVVASNFNGKHLQRTHNTNVHCTYSALHLLVQHITVLCNQRKCIYVYVRTGDDWVRYTSVCAHG